MRRGKDAKAVLRLRQLLGRRFANPSAAAAEFASVLLQLDQSHRVDTHNVRFATGRMRLL